MKWGSLIVRNPDSNKISLEFVHAPGVYDEQAILSSMWDVDWSDYIARCEQLRQSIASELQN